MEPESTLIEQMKQGDMAAFEKLFEKHRRGLLAYVYGMTGNRTLSEDVVQDCFVALAQNISRIRPRKGVSGWLYRVARNRAVDHFREKRAASDESPGHASERTPDPSPLPADIISHREDITRLEGALADLPPRDRELLTLRYYGGLRFREVAQVLGRPLGTVLWQGHRAIARLRELFERH